MSAKLPTMKHTLTAIVLVLYFVAPTAAGPYAEGRGVPQDYVRAHMWFSLAAAQGEQRAVKTLEMAERKMTPDQIAEAQKLARDWKPVTQPTPH